MDLCTRSIPTMLQALRQRLEANFVLSMSRPISWPNVAGNVLDMLGGYMHPDMHCVEYILVKELGIVITKLVAPNVANEI